MTYADTLLPEFDQEMASTRKVLERVPEDKLDWQAHPKSRTIGWNANHLVEIAGWTEGILTQSEWDIAPAGEAAYQSPNFRTRKELLENFDQGVAASRKAIQQVSEHEVGQTWALKQTGETVFAMPRAAVIRTFVLNHMIHHRAHLLVYLRLNDIPVPGMYGPSADE